MASIIQMIITLFIKNIPALIPYLLKLFTVWRDGKEVSKDEKASLKSEEGLHSPLKMESEFIAHAMWHEGRVVEATGKNDGEFIETFLESVNAPKGSSWCAAFIYYCALLVKKDYPQTKLKLLPSPSALDMFNKTVEAYSNRIQAEDIQPGDVFFLRRIDSTWQGHCGVVVKAPDKLGNYMTVEGNWKNKVCLNKRNIKTPGNYFQNHGFLRIF